VLLVLVLILIFILILLLRERDRVGPEHLWQRLLTTDERRKGPTLAFAARLVLDRPRLVVRWHHCNSSVWAKDSSAYYSSMCSRPDAPVVT
jgi:hypothetical protein